MGLADTFGAEDRVPLKVSDLMTLMRSDSRNFVRNQFIVNGLKAHLPHNHILMMIGENPTCVEGPGTEKIAQK